MKKKQPESRYQGNPELRAIPVSGRTLVPLAQHALTLERGHPVQAIAQLLLERYDKAEAFDFGDDDGEWEFELPADQAEWQAAMEAA